MMSWFILLLQICSLTAFEVTQTDSDITVREDETLELSCTGSEPWDYCRWTFYGRECSRTVQSTSSKCDIDDSGRITWVGVPEIDDTCTLNVAQPGTQDSGSWTCQLLQQNIAVAVASKSFKVTVYSRTVVSFGSRPYQKMMVGNEYTIECLGEGGVPSPTLVALVGPEETIGDTDITLEAIGEASDGMVGGTVSKLFKYEPNKDYASMFLKCMAFQSDIDGYNIYEPDIFTSSFEVVFPPLPSEAPLQTFFIDEGETATVLISFDANPPPTNDQVVWHVVRPSSNQSLMMEAGNVHGRYEALDVIVDGTFVTATLLIHQANYEDVMNYCYLEAMNELGKFDYNFELTPRPIIVSTPVPIDDQGDGGLSVGAIVGIVIGCILALFAVLILLCFLIKQKLCCFADSKSKNINDDAEYMSAAQRDNTTQRNDYVTAQMSNSGQYQSRDELDDEEIRPIVRNTTILTQQQTATNGGVRSTPQRESYKIATSEDRDSTYPVQ